MSDGSVLQSAQRCFEKRSRVVVKMVVTEREGRTGRILPEVFPVGKTRKTESNILPVRSRASES